MLPHLRRRRARMMGETMLPRTALSLVAIATLAGSPAAFGQSGLEIPTPDFVVQRAWEHAGGLEAFGRLGIVLADFSTEENTQEGNPTTTRSKTYFLAPGPTPGRIEIEAIKAVSGDSGGRQAGWAVIGGKPDIRQSTQMMVKKLLTTNLFTLMLPFSLNWDGVLLKTVEPTVVKGVPVWRLSIEVARGFFHSPQIATTWRIDFDRKTYAVVQAESPATDLGKGLKADGMRISWAKLQDVRGIRLPGEQRTIGLSETGAEKAHSRLEQVRYSVLEAEGNAAMFRDPVPPELRPTPQVGPSKGLPMPRPKT